MNEIQFIEQSKARWERLGRVLKGIDNSSVDELTELYMHTADDLSYARTFFGKSKVVPYLNALVLNAHRTIYKNRFITRDALSRFFKIRLPLAIWKNRRHLLASLIVFMLFLLIGWFSSSVDPSFARLILGDSYVNMTMLNIEKGDPMAVYGEMENASMFFFIGQNNIRVAFIAFMLGIFSSLGTALLLMYNGIMLGTFLYFFYERSLAAIAWSTIFIHGAIEISAIVIAGGAGFILGNSFLFPGTFSRVYALRKGAGEGILIMISLIPVFVVAAFLESYVTRHYQILTMFSRLLIIGTTMAFLIWYYFMYSKRAYDRFTSS